jgi:FkbM family methyltransferase
VLHAIAREAYSYRLPASPVHFVIDAGANIGDTTVWYATRFPEALVAAIEPNPYNFEILSRNCALYGDRIRLFKAGLWPVADRSLAVLGATEGSWVEESSDASGLSCRTLDPLTILRDAGFETIDIFKIDIEGAELPLFSGDCDKWLQKTRSITIEIHSQEAREAILSATKRNGFKFAVYRDLHVFWK